MDTENKIRRALGGSGYEIIKQDGTPSASGTLLPSAFFTVRREGDVFIVSGGGFGHGIGMSQNGANEMAKKGKNYNTFGACGGVTNLFMEDFPNRPALVGGVLEAECREVLSAFFSGLRQREDKLT